MNTSKRLGVPTVAAFSVCLALAISGARVCAQRSSAIDPWRLGEFADQEAAVAALREHVKKFKRDPGGWYFLGLALVRQGDLPKAKAAFKEAVNLHPGYYLARIGLARTLLLENHDSEAESEARRIFGKGANGVDSHYLFGLLHLLNLDPMRALAEADASIAANISPAPAYFLKYQALVAGADVVQKAETNPKPSRMSDAAKNLNAYLTLSSELDATDFLRYQLQSLILYGEADAQYNRQSLDRQLFFPTEVTTKARILTKPVPQYSEAARDVGIEGTVVLQLVFSANGNVEHILVLRSLPFGLTDMSIDAAKRIKFTPATKDGKPISLVVRMKYNFNLY